MSRDPAILCGCRFCGEHEHLNIDRGAFERHGVEGGEVREIVAQGHAAVGAEYVDAVHCDVCETIAALDTWNGTRPATDYDALRAYYFDPDEQVAA